MDATPQRRRAGTGGQGGRGVGRGVGRVGPRGGAGRLLLVAGLTVVPLVALLGTVSAAPLAPPLGACSGPDCPNPFPPPNNGDFAGRDATINVFVGGNYTVQGRAAEAEGKIVTLGDLSIAKTGGGVFNMAVVGVGSRVVPPNGSDFVTVGGAISVATGNSLLVGGVDSQGAATGNVRHGGTSTGTVDVVAPGQLIQDPAAGDPYLAVRTQIEDVSACTGTAAATGTVTLTNSEATFTGDGTSARQVFNVTGNLASSSGGSIGLDFTGIPAGATVVVNMLSADAVINTFTGSGAGDDPITVLGPRLLWNFPNSTTPVITGGAQFQGSVMAGNPAGTTTIETPGLNGRVYLAGNLIQQGAGGYEIHNYPFEGDLPDCTTPTPTPTTTTPTPTPTDSNTTPTPTSSTSTSTTPTATATTSTAGPTATTATPSRSTGRPTASATSTSTGPSLADTGSEVLPVVGIGLGCLGLGWAALRLPQVRRRRH